VRVFPVLLVATALGLCASLSTAQATSGRPIDSVPAEFVLDVEQLAAELRISTGEAQAAMENSGPIIDFIGKWGDDPRFGAVWATYTDGYQVHLRLLDDTFLAEVRVLQEQVGREVTVTKGGASFAVLRKATIELAKVNKVRFRENTRDGLLEVFADSPAWPSPSLIDLRYVVGIAEVTPEEVPSAPRAGADVWRWNGSAWTQPCTSGFMWGGYGITGYSTAGHCLDATASLWQSVDGGASSPSSPMVAEACVSSGVDYQLIKFSTAADQSEDFIDKYASYATRPVYSVAGGFYAGQPTRKVGKNSNGATGSNVGEAIGFSSVSVGGINDCGPGTFTAFRVTNDGTGGDSGGPIYAYYNYTFQLAGTMTSNPADTLSSSTSWIGWIPMPGYSSIHICTGINPCN